MSENALKLDFIHKTFSHDCTNMYFQLIQSSNSCQNREEQLREREGQLLHDREEQLRDREEQLVDDNLNNST